MSKADNLHMQVLADLGRSYKTAQLSSCSCRENCDCMHGLQDRQHPPQYIDWSQMVCIACPNQVKPDPKPTQQLASKLSSHTKQQMKPGLHHKECVQTNTLLHVNDQTPDKAETVSWNAVVPPVGHCSHHIRSRAYSPMSMHLKC